MDSKQRKKGEGKIEIIRESRVGRKMRLSDIMSESFSTYLAELDGDFVAPTGSRISRIDEVDKSDIAALAHKKSQDRKASGKSGTQQDDWLEAEQELRDQEDAAAAETAAAAAKEREAELYPDSSQGAPSSPAARVRTPAPTAAQPIPDEGDPTVPAVDPDDQLSTVGGGDSSTANTDGGDDSETNNDDNPSSIKPEDSNGAESIQDPATPSDQDGGPDEFDEKNKAFTSYIDSLIASGDGTVPGDNDSSVPLSERSDARAPRRSLIEAVYGAPPLEIIKGR